MDPKRDFRDLKKYLSRRGVSGDSKVKAWLVSSQIFTLEQLEAFCAPRELRFSETQFVNLLVPPAEESKPVEQTKKPTSREPSSDESSESWHVPAAKRPLKKAKAPAPSRSRRKKKKGE